MTEQVTDTAAPEAQPPSLGVNDLAAMVQVIDVCSKRGAFEGAELESVGILRGRVARFLEANRPPEEEKPAEAAPTPEAEAEA